MYYTSCTKATTQIFSFGVKGTWPFLTARSPWHRSCLAGSGWPKGSPAREGELPPASSHTLAGGTASSRAGKELSLQNLTEMGFPFMPQAAPWLGHGVPADSRWETKRSNSVGLLKMSLGPALWLQVDRDPFQRCLGWLQFSGKIYGATIDSVPNLKTL